MKQKHKVLNRYSVSFFIVLVFATAVATVVSVRHTSTDAVTSTKPKIGAAVPSQFSTTGTVGWQQGATNGTSMALFHSDYDCFVSVQHNTGTIAEGQTKLHKSLADLTNEGHSVTSTGTQAMSMETNSGPQQYRLRQYTVTNPSGVSSVEGGQEYGYVQLTDGYVYVQGNCDTST